MNILLFYVSPWVVGTIVVFFTNTGTAQTVSSDTSRIENQFQVKPSSQLTYLNSIYEQEVSKANVNLPTDIDAIRRAEGSVQRTIERRTGVLDNSVFQVDHDFLVDQLHFERAGVSEITCPTGSVLVVRGPLLRASYSSEGLRTIPISPILGCYKSGPESSYFVRRFDYIFGRRNVSFSYITKSSDYVLQENQSLLMVEKEIVYDNDRPLYTTSYEFQNNRVCREYHDSGRTGSVSIDPKGRVRVIDNEEYERLITGYQEQVHSTCSRCSSSETEFSAPPGSTLEGDLTIVRRRIASIVAENTNSWVRLSDNEKGALPTGIQTIFRACRSPSVLVERERPERILTANEKEGGKIGVEI